MIADDRTVEGVLTPERFLLEHYSSLPVPIYTPDAFGRDYFSAFHDACARNGLDLRKTDERRYDVVSGGETIGRLRGMVTSLVNRRAINVCKNKAETIARLARADVPAPEQGVFNESDVERALEFARSRQFDIVVKPCFGGGGIGITVTIRTAEEFREAWIHARDNLPSERPAEIIVETKCPGMDIRAVVVAGRFSCAATRVPANVIGDGTSTLAELIARKNALRRAHPHHCHYLLDINDRFLKRLAGRGHSLDTVLPTGTPLILSEVSNVRGGGDACEITHLVPDHIRRIAEQAARAVPGLGVAGVDLMVSALNDEALVSVLEMNTHPSLTIHHTPFVGTPRTPADDIVRAMMNAASSGRPRVSSPSQPPGNHQSASLPPPADAGEHRTKATKPLTDPERYRRLLRRRGGAVPPSFTALMDSMRRRARYAEALTGRSAASRSLTNKILQKKFFAAAGEPSPAIRLGPVSLPEALNWLSSEAAGTRSNLVLKPVGSHGAKGVYLISTDQTTMRHMRSGKLLSNEEFRLAVQEEAASLNEEFGWFIEDKVGAGFSDRVFDIKLYTFSGIAPLILIKTLGDNGAPAYAWIGSDNRPKITGKYEDALYRGEDLPLTRAVNLRDAAVRIASSFPVPFCRVDFIAVADTYSIGEITPAPGGYWRFNAELDLEMGIHLEAAQSRFMTRFGDANYTAFHEIFGRDNLLGL